MNVEELAPDVEVMVNEIQAQMGLRMFREGCVDLLEIARRADIACINQAPLDGCEALLVSDPQKSDGAILVNNRVPMTRRRFSVAHELGHWFFPTHIPKYDCESLVSSSGPGSLAERSLGTGALSGAFAPSIEVEDLNVRDSGTSSVQRRDQARTQEDEADRFAQALLMPKALAEQSAFANSPSIDRLCDFAKAFKVSKSAAARRLVELNCQPIAILFTSSGQLERFITSPSCPHLGLPYGWKHRGFVIPEHEGYRDQDWLAEDRLPQFPTKNGNPFWAQQLVGEYGYGLTLLRFQFPKAPAAAA